MRKNIIRLLPIVSLLCLFTVLTACSISLRSQILSSTDINPDDNGRPSPLVVRIYELKSSDVFDSADFFQLYDEEEATLGGDLISREQFEFSPGEGREIIHKANEEARYFGVVAAFRNLDQSRWRASTKLKQKKNNSLIVRIGRQTVTINHK